MYNEFNTNDVYITMSNRTWQLTEFAASVNRDEVRPMLGSMGDAYQTGDYSTINYRDGKIYTLYHSNNARIITPSGLLHVSQGDVVEFSYKNKKLANAEILTSSTLHRLFNPGTSIIYNEEYNSLYGLGFDASSSTINISQFDLSSMIISTYAYENYSIPSEPQMSYNIKDNKIFILISSASLQSQLLVFNLDDGTWITNVWSNGGMLDLGIPSRLNDGLYYLIILNNTAGSTSCLQLATYDIYNNTFSSEVQDIIVDGGYDNNWLGVTLSAITIDNNDNIYTNINNSEVHSIPANENGTLNTKLIKASDDNKDPIINLQYRDNVLYSFTQYCISYYEGGVWKQSGPCGIFVYNIYDEESTPFITSRSSSSSFACSNQPS